jgi:flagellar motility protein MotE (MotC chaperone)
MTNSNLQKLIALSSRWRLLVVGLAVGALLATAVAAVAQTTDEQPSAGGFGEDLRQKKAALEKREKEIDKRSKEVDKLAAELKKREAELDAKVREFNKKRAEEMRAQEQEKKAEEKQQAGAEKGAEPQGKEQKGQGQKEKEQKGAKAGQTQQGANQQANNQQANNQQANNQQANNQQAGKPGVDPKKIDELAKKVKAMKPAAAAALFGELEPALAVAVYETIDARSSGKILNKMPPNLAARLSEKMVRGGGAQ